MSQLTGLKLAFADPKTYMLAKAYMAITGASGFQNYFPTLTRTLGYNDTISLLLVAAPYIFMVAYSLFHSHLSDRLRNRFWFFSYPIPVTIIDFIIFMTIDNSAFGPRCFSFFLMMFVFAMNGTCCSWIASAIPRPPAKRAAAYAFINAVGNSASIWTPYTYRDQDEPYFHLALGVCIALQVLAAAMALTLRWYLVRQNRQLERLEEVDVPLGEREMRKLRRTAEIEGVGLEQARVLQKGFRYMI